MANSVFSENLCLYTFHTLQGCEILPKHSPWRSFMKFVVRSHVTSTNQRFFKFKILKKLTRKCSRRIGKWLVWQFCLTLWMNYWRCTVGFFSFQIHWKVMSIFEFRDEPRNPRCRETRTDRKSVAKRAGCSKNPLIFGLRISFIQWGVNETITKLSWRFEENRTSGWFYFLKQKKNIRNGIHWTAEKLLQKR